MKKIVLAALLATVFSASANAAVDLSTWATGGQAYVGGDNVAVLSADGTIAGNVTDLISFEWRFKAEDYLPYNDYAQVSFNGVSYKLSDVGTVGNYGDSGWNTYTLNSAFSGLVEFGVFNVIDSSLDSQLFVRNVTAVPEPETYAMMLGGLGLMGLAARRRKAAAKA